MNAPNDLTSSNSVQPTRVQIEESPAHKSFEVSAKKPFHVSDISILSHPSLLEKNLAQKDGEIPTPNSLSSSTFDFSSRYFTKSPLRALTIDTNNEASSFNGLEGNRLGSYSATHHPAHQHVHTKNSLISSFAGNMSAKYSRAVESYRRPAPNSPSKNNATSKSLVMNSFLSAIASTGPSKMTSSFKNDYAASILNSLTPTSTHLKKFSNKSYSQERNKVTLGETFDMRGVPKNQFRKIALTEPEHRVSESSRSFHVSNDSQNLSSLDRSREANSERKNLTKAKSTTSCQNADGKKVMIPLPNHEPTKCSVQRNGIVKAYAANTNQGIVRNYNEDRVSIILNIMKPASRVNEEWPKCSFFGVYDGHGGVACADFLRDNLHQYVIKESSFPWNPREALLKGFEAAERAFLDLAENGPNGEVERSGSCALVLLIVGEMCYVANVGDSRGVMSGDGGTKIYPLSKDHKPNEEAEQKRIIEAGGRIYQSQAPALKYTNDLGAMKGQMELLLGPHRVLPGRLSVSRTFGDIHAKNARFGGNPNVVIATPDIKAFRVNNDHDFIILATDGIYDKLTSRDVVKTIWENVHKSDSNIHQQCGLAVENILRESILRRTLDNITVVMIGFENFRLKLSAQDVSNQNQTPIALQRDTKVGSVKKLSSFANTSGTASGNPESPAQSEKQNLQEKVNQEEKSNIGDVTKDKIKALDAKFASGNSHVPKRHSMLVENKSTLDSGKKENSKEKEFVPISDVHLLSKRLLAKRGNEAQKLHTSNRSLAPGKGSVSPLFEPKSAESGRSDTKS